MAEYKGKSYDPDDICQDDYEYLTNTGRYSKEAIEAYNGGKMMAQGMIALLKGEKEAIQKEIEATQNTPVGPFTPSFIEGYQDILHNYIIAEETEQNNA